MFIDELKTKLEELRPFITTAISKIGELWNSFPPFVRTILVITIIVACINIFLSLVKAVIANRSTWKPKSDCELMYSFLGGSGQYQRSHIYSDAHKLLFDKTWSHISFAGIAFRLGNIESESKTLSFLASLAYIPLTILGMTEMVFRAIVGVVFFFGVNLVYFVLLLLLGIINTVLIPIFNLMDKSTYETQHCPTCYTTYRLPAFECPHCGKIHNKLYPGRCGLLWAKCACGHFIPCSSMSKRKKLASYCPNPSCNQLLAGANIKSLTVQIVGGNSSGKTAFIAAFQHLYRNMANTQYSGKIIVSPSDDFELLESYYREGRTEKSSTDTVHAYYILHQGSGHSDQGIILYDVPDEIILSEQYERNPLNFGYSDGVVIIIDPLSVRSVRKECESSLGTAYINGYSDDSSEDIIIHFINKYSEVAGRKARKMSDIPVAVVIAKADIPIIKQKIGTVKIKAQYKSNQSQFTNYDEARDNMCRSYLVDIGLANSLNNLESVFSHVSFFPISAIGHAEAEMAPFDAWGVIEPIDWIARTSQNVLQTITGQIIGGTK